MKQFENYSFLCGQFYFHIFKLTVFQINYYVK